jgi:hypothetical protein
MTNKIAEIEALYAKYDALFGTTAPGNLARRNLTHDDLSLLASIENLLTYKTAYSVLVPNLQSAVTEASLATWKKAP